MNRLSMGTRIAIALTMLSTTVLLLLRTVGLFQDGHEELLKARARLCESVAVSCSEFFSRDDAGGVSTVLAALVVRNDDVLSAAFRDDERGKVSLVSGPHAEVWTEEAKGKAHCIFVPVLTGRQRIGQIEVSFIPLVLGGFWGFLTLPSVKVVMLATLLNLFAFGWCLRRCFRFLDPSRAVPDRVRSALDTITEGVLVLDSQRKVVMANQSLSNVLGSSPDMLRGLRLSELPWAPRGTVTSETTNGHESTLSSDRDWSELIAAAESADGNSQPKIRLENERQGVLTFFVNSATIYDDEQRPRGTLLSLNDVTIVERKNQELQTALATLRLSQDEIEQQNERLQFLATRDPLTCCLNRRSFFDTLEQQWKAAERYKFPISCIMADIDYFKSVNDNRGHAMGDDVLKRVADALLHVARETDFVCRYGGEEFCILLPHTDLAGAQAAAERCRHQVAQLEFDELDVTISAGVSSLSLGPSSPSELIEQADQALYAAKRDGRNRTVAFDGIPRDSRTNRVQIERVAKPKATSTTVPLDDGLILQLLHSLAAEVNDVSGQGEQMNQVCDTLSDILANLNERPSLQPAGVNPHGAAE